VFIVDAPALKSSTIQLVAKWISLVRSDVSHTDDWVVTLDLQMSPYILKQAIYYQEFIVLNNHRYVADIFSL
jgi:hypothetical protein